MSPTRAREAKKGRPKSSQKFRLMDLSNSAAEKIDACMIQAAPCSALMIIEVRDKTGTVIAIATNSMAG